MASYHPLFGPVTSLPPLVPKYAAEPGTKIAVVDPAGNGPQAQPFPVPAHLVMSGMPAAGTPLRHHTAAFGRRVNQVWPGASNLRKGAIRTWIARWGPAAQPQNPAPGTVDFIRATFWRSPNGSPKCHSCWAANSPMPNGNSIIFEVSSSQDLLACGCKYEDAFLEAWLIAINGWTESQGQNNIFKAIGRTQRDIIKPVLHAVLGVYPSPQALIAHNAPTTHPQ